MLFQRCTESKRSITFVNLGFPSHLDSLSVVTGQNESQGNVSEQLLLIIIINARGQMTNCPL